MTAEAALTKERMLSLFEKLNHVLRSKGVKADINLVGGAVMCLAFNARNATMDIDAYFIPTQVVRDIAKDIAIQEGLSHAWLNDGVKGFFSARGEFTLYLEKSHLTIYVAKPEYLLAMKCLSMRIGEEFSDIRDVAFLLRYLNIETLEHAITTISHYYDFKKFPAKTKYVLQDLLAL